MKKLLAGFLFISIFCNAQIIEEKKSIDDSIRDVYINSISFTNLKDFVSHLAADSMRGRETGDIGQFMAKRYIFSELTGDKYKLKIDPESCVQPFKIDGKLAENIIIGFPGTTKKDEYIVVGAHYDHVGKQGTQIYNGADDNASGTAAVMEMIRVFSKAILDGYRPKRSVIFAFFSAEELGLWGSKVYVSDFSEDYSSIYANLNIDMIGRIDDSHRNKESYVYTVGSDYFSDDLDVILNEVNEETVNIKIEKDYNSVNNPNRYHMRTDSFPFALQGVPFIFFTNGEHPDYHKTTDTATKIEYRELKKRTQLIFGMLWELANREESLNIDQEKVIKYQSRFGQKPDNGEK